MICTHFEVFIFKFFKHRRKEIKFVAHVLFYYTVDCLRGFAYFIEDIQRREFINLKKQINIFDEKLLNIREFSIPQHFIGFANFLNILEQFMDETDYLMLVLGPQKLL